MALKKNKREKLGPGWGNLPVQEGRRIYTKEELDLFEKQLIRDRYVLGESKILSLEKELDYMKDQRIINLKKLKPAGMCKVVTDFQISIRKDMSTRYDEESDKIRQWQSRKGYIEHSKNMAFVGHINMAEKYAPRAWKEKKEEEKKLATPVVKKAEPVKPKVEPKELIEPFAIDPSSIEI